MIKVSGKFLAKKVEQKSIKKRDGGTFDFTEVVLEQVAKKPTTIVARVSDKVVDEIIEGSKCELDIVITSWESDTGKIWNNFVIMDVIDVEHGAVQQAQSAPVSDYADDDIPF
jgi:hypothetical protein